MNVHAEVPTPAFEDGLRSTNDPWMACAVAFGLQDFVLGTPTPHDGAPGPVHARLSVQAAVT